MHTLHPSARVALAGVMLLAVSILASCGNNDPATQSNNTQVDMAPDLPVDMGPPSCTTNDECTGDWAGAHCIEGVCETCEAGTLDCVCFVNGSCDAMLSCDDDDICEACVPGTQGCPCDAGSCVDDLVCGGDDVCVPDSCTLGALNCPCDAGNCAGDDAYCGPMNTCLACSSDIAGCPCDAGEVCQGANFCDAGTCAACPDTDAPDGCACQQNLDCATGLACDDDDRTCRTPKTCAELCLANQLCDVSGAGDPVCVPNACVDGYTWDGTACVMQQIETCDGRDASIDKSVECDGLNKVCVETGRQSAVCVDTCAIIGDTCAMQNRDCDEGDVDADAACGICRLGYADDGNGACVVDTTVNCSPASGTSILAACQARNQVCVEITGGGAECGGCLNDTYVFDPSRNACVQGQTCGGVVCASDEYCDYPQTGGPPVCTTIPGSCAGSEAFDAGTSACIACTESCGVDGAHPVTIDGACVCAEDLFCAYQYDGAGDRCVTNGSTPCANGEAFDSTNNSCITCNITCGDDEGERARAWVLSTKDGSCTCETQEGYYVPFGGASKPLRCDADVDGWINSTANQTFEVARDARDAATLSNFRCELRQIDAVVLENEWGQKRHVSLCGNDLVDYEPGPPPACGNGFTRLTLFEADKLDSDDAITLDDTNFPLYGGRKLAASEVNALTKACVSENGDFNLNGVEDLREEQSVERTRINGLTFTSDEEFVFHSMAHFLELHRTRYVRPARAGEAGRYVISERSRCDAGADFALGYTRGEYWRQCSRSRRATWDQSALSYNGYDFAKWGCSAQPSGTCAIESPPLTGMDTDNDRVEDHGLCDNRAAGLLPLGNTPWRGMNHHSQFQCVVLKGASPSGNHERLLTDTLFEPNMPSSGSYVFNDCAANACAAGMIGCAESLGQGALQPRATQLGCVVETRSSASIGDVGFLSARYTPEGKPPPSLAPTNEAASTSRTAPMASTIGTPSALVTMRTPMGCSRQATPATSAR